MVLSSRPSETSDFTVMIICGDMGYLGFWRPGNEAWNKIDMPLGCFTDVTYHNEHFYAIDHLGFVYVFNLERNNQDIEGGVVTCLIDDGYNYMNKLPSELSKRHRSCKGGRVPFNKLVVWKALYILGSDRESLLLIARTSDKWNTDENMTYRKTSEFHVYEVDVRTGLWREIHSLGNMAIFIGLNTTVSVDASRFPAFIKANSIYFTDDGWESYFFYKGKEGGKDMGVCDLETGKIEQFYHGELVLSQISPSIWITPCF